MTELISNINHLLAGNIVVALITALVWGVISVVLSPCHLASIPLLIGYLSMQQHYTRAQVVLASALFACGMLVSIATIGAITIGLGRIAGDVGPAGKYIVAAVFIITGLVLLDVIPLPNWQPKVNAVKSKSMLGVFGLGLVLGFALGPCTFAFMAPVLGIVYHASRTNPIFAFSMMLFFAIGHCGIITIAGSMTPFVQRILNWHEANPNSHWFRKICGILVIFAGLYFIYTS